MLRPIRLFNTLSGRIEPLEPLSPPKLGFYACGPTVYNRAHVGNFRTFVAIDVLRRTLTHLGYVVHEVMNVTDVYEAPITDVIAAAQRMRPNTRRPASPEAVEKADAAGLAGSR